MFILLRNNFNKLKQPRSNLSSYMYKLYIMYMYIKCTNWYAGWGEWELRCKTKGCSYGWLLYKHGVENALGENLLPDESFYPHFFPPQPLNALMAYPYVPFWHSAPSYPRFRRLLYFFRSFRGTFITSFGNVHEGPLDGRDVWKWARLISPRERLLFAIPSTLFAPPRPLLYSRAWWIYESYRYGPFFTRRI